MIPREMVSLMERRRLVAEVRTATAIQALSVVDALAAGGVTTVEISLTIPGAQEILSHLATRSDIVVGAGAVLDERQAREMIGYGARFIASPILAKDLVAPCRDNNVACILGALTPTEIIEAQRAGAEMVKLFPAEALGGPIYVRALLQQLTHVSLQISGGFTAEHLVEYLGLPVRTVAVGSLLVPRVLVERGNWQAISARARAFVEFAANPHANAARFLSIMGVAQPRPAPVPAQGASGALAPDPAAAAAAARVAQVPTMPVPPGGIPYPAERSTPPAHDPAASGSFRPWDSRPIEQGDDEDWLR